MHTLPTLPTLPICMGNTIHRVSIATSWVPCDRGARQAHACGAVSYSVHFFLGSTDTGIRPPSTSPSAIGPTISEAIIRSRSLCIHACHQPLAAAGCGGVRANHRHVLDLGSFFCRLPFAHSARSTSSIIATKTDRPPTTAYVDSKGGDAVEGLGHNRYSFDPCRRLPIGDMEQT